MIRSRTKHIIPLLPCISDLLPVLPHVTPHSTEDVPGLQKTTVSTTRSSYLAVLVGTQKNLGAPPPGPQEHTVPQVTGGAGVSSPRLYRCPVPGVTLLQVGLKLDTGFLPGAAVLALASPGGGHWAAEIDGSLPFPVAAAAAEQ